jgi:hypothetical protein
MNRMTFVCLAGAAAFAGGVATWSIIRRYTGRGSSDKKRVKKVAEQQGYNEAIAEQLA